MSRRWQPEHSKSPVSVSTRNSCRSTGVALSARHPGHTNSRERTNTARSSRQPSAARCILFKFSGNRPTRISPWMRSTAGLTYRQESHVLKGLNGLNRVKPASCARGSGSRPATRPRSPAPPAPPRAARRSARTRFFVGTACGTGKSGEKSYARESIFTVSGPARASPAPRARPR